MSLVKKWLSDETPEEAELFRHCKEMEYVCYAVNKVILDAETKWKGCHVNHTNMSFSNRSYIIGLVNIQVLDQTIDYLSKLVRSFYKLNPKLARLKKDDPLLLSKHDHTFDKLCSKRFILLQSTYGLIMTILNNCLHREDIRKMMESCLSLISIYNQLIGLSYKTFASKFNICSNTYPTVISETKTITLTKMVQVLSKSRVEINCHRLINCLVKIYQPENSDNEAGSSTSDSIEIYHTLTKHITPPTSSAPRQMTLEKKREAFVEIKKTKTKQCKSMIDIKSNQGKKFPDITEGRNSDSDIPYTSLLTTDCVIENIYNSGESVNGILQSEEMYIEILLDTVANMAPDMLGANGIKKLKSGGVQATKRAARKVTEYYQGVLWGDVGSCLEHIVLWWSTCPLANRSPNTSQNLREWLMTFNVNNTPELVLSAMRILADALGCHVTSTSWDKLFAATAVTNLQTTSIKQHPDLSVHVTDCTVTGANFALMLQQLVTLNNQCEVTGEYILGAPLEDLPIVEQIPILHRLDHSVHTYRLWCLAQTRALAGAWQVDDLFRITHHDMPACMDQLLSLRFADHSHTIETGKIGVHENVCAKMREKLVSEVKVNIQKLKEATEEITCVLSSVCGTTSLAHLTMIFPSAAEWRQITNPPDSTHSIYVYEFLDMMLLPVIRATDDVTALNMVLRIMCEAWLHHIYVARVKFSKDAAVQLLSDFNEVRNWLAACDSLGHAARKLMLHNEVLRRCEGVGRLLLHAPGDLISMRDSTAQLPPHARTENTDTPEQLMPAEMYVPNQKQWLTLRMKGPFAFSLCCIVLG